MSIATTKLRNARGGGVYRFPADLATRIAVGTAVSEISGAPRGIERAVFCCFSEDSATHHMHAFAELGLG